MALVCYLHPSSSAQDRCVACRRTICPGCVVAERRAILCRSCAAQRAHQRRRVRVGLAVAAGLLIAALALAVSVASGCSAAGARLL